MDRSEYTFYQARLQGAGKPPGLLARALRLLVVLVVLVLGFMFSLVAFAVLAVGGALAWGYFWWKTRAVRKAMREHMAAEMDARRAAGAAHGRGGAGTRGLIIEGEVIREVKVEDPPADAGRDRP